MLKNLINLDWGDLCLISKRFECSPIQNNLLFLFKIFRIKLRANLKDSKRKTYSKSRWINLSWLIARSAWRPELLIRLYYRVCTHTTTLVWEHGSPRILVVLFAKWISMNYESINKIKSTISPLRAWLLRDQFIDSLAVGHILLENVFKELQVELLIFLHVNHAIESGNEVHSILCKC